MGSYILHYEDGTSSLCHYGTKGQKWGVRRYQNEDGTYTQAGLDRYFKKPLSNRKANKMIRESSRELGIAAAGAAGEAYKHQRKADKLATKLGKHMIKNYGEGKKYGELGDGPNKNDKKGAKLQEKVAKHALRASIARAQNQKMRDLKTAMDNGQLMPGVDFVRTTSVSKRAVAATILTGPIGGTIAGLLGGFNRSQIATRSGDVYEFRDSQEITAKNTTKRLSSRNNR